MVSIPVVFIVVLVYVIYIKEVNIRKQGLLEITIKDIQRKEEEIRVYKDELEEYKKLKQQSDAQVKKIEELENVIEGLNSEIEENKVELEKIKEKL